MRRGWVVILFVLLSMSSSGCSALVESRYTTYDQAVQGGAIERGWLPEVMPATASNIREAHDADTNQVWVSFDFPQEAVESLSSLCSPVSFDQVTLPASGPRWWDTQALKDPWNAFYVCGDPASLGYLAVLGTGDQAYYWSYR
jgi:hypothetical protein